MCVILEGKGQAVDGDATTKAGEQIYEITDD